MPRQGCPVCGRYFNGTLVHHLNKPVSKSGVTRCEWNLNSERVRRIPRRLVAKGWVRARGQARLLTAVKLPQTHPHLVRQYASGDVHTRVSGDLMRPEQDIKVWWCRLWVKALFSVTPWTLRRRWQLVNELDGQREPIDAIEAVCLLSGLDAVHELAGTAIPPQCPRYLCGARCVLSMDHNGECLL